jgi:hypothetical protein
MIATKPTKPKSQYQGTTDAPDHAKLVVPSEEEFAYLTRCLMVAVAGYVFVEMLDDSDAYIAVPLYLTAGCWHPVVCRKVLPASYGTTATGIVRGW